MIVRTAQFINNRLLLERNDDGSYTLTDVLPNRIAIIIRANELEEINRIIENDFAIPERPVHTDIDDDIPF